MPDDKRQGPPVMFRGAEIEREIAKRQRRSETLGATAKRDIERYYALLKADPPRVNTQTMRWLNQRYGNLLKAVEPDEWQAFVDQAYDAAKAEHSAGNLNDSSVVRGLAEMTSLEFFRTIDVIERARIMCERAGTDGQESFDGALTDAIHAVD